MSEIKPRADIFEAMEFMLKATMRFKFEFQDEEAPIETLIRSISKSRDDENELYWRERELQEQLEQVREQRKRETNKQIHLFEALNKLTSLEDFHKIYKRAVELKKN